MLLERRRAARAAPRETTSLPDRRRALVPVADEASSSSDDASPARKAARLSMAPTTWRRADDVPPDDEAPVAPAPAPAVPPPNPPAPRQTVPAAPVATLAAASTPTAASESMPEAFYGRRVRTPTDTELVLLNLIRLHFYLLDKPQTARRKRARDAALLADVMAGRFPPAALGLNSRGDDLAKSIATLDPIVRAMQTSGASLTIGTPLELVPEALPPSPTALFRWLRDQHAGDGKARKWNPKGPNRPRAVGFQGHAKALLQKHPELLVNCLAALEAARTARSVAAAPTTTDGRGRRPLPTDPTAVAMASEAVRAAEKDKRRAEAKTEALAAENKALRVRVERSEVDDGMLDRCVRSLRKALDAALDAVPTELVCKPVGEISSAEARIVAQMRDLAALDSDVVDRAIEASGTRALLTRMMATTRCVSRGAEIKFPGAIFDSTPSRRRPDGPDSLVDLHTGAGARDDQIESRLFEVYRDGSRPSMQGPGREHACAPCSRRGVRHGRDGAEHRDAAPRSPR